MNKLTVLISFALALAIVYIAFFSDWLKPQNIHVVSRISPANGALMFYMDKAYPVTSIEIVAAEDAKTNKYPHALWHVVAASGPVPMETFCYGASIPGMKPEIASALPETLQPGTDYSLLLECGKHLKGLETFKVH